MLLKELLQDVPGIVETQGSLDTDIGALSINSREKSKRGLFFCISGAKFDAHDFAKQAVENGCVALIVSRFLDDVVVPQVKVENVRSAMAYLAGAFFGHADRKLRLIGVSGTKGKTTTSYLLKAIMEKAGFKVGLIGTTGNMIGNEHIKSNLTTPDPIDLHRCFRHALRDAPAGMPAGSRLPCTTAVFAGGAGGRPPGNESRTAGTAGRYRSPLA